MDIDSHGLLFVYISDNGAGIPDNIRSRIFEPFFSTKEAGKGAGLGLSIARKVFQMHRGEIYLSETSPRRTIFEIVLPQS